MLDARIRNFFPFLNSETVLKAVNRKAGKRIALDNAASTQLSLPALEALLGASLNYANVHRGFYDASAQSGVAMEMAYNTAANLVNAASWQEIVLGTNTTGMINLVALGLRSQFEDGDNIVLTELEHSSNVGPWLGLKDSLLKGRAPVKVELRFARFDLASGELDYDHLRSLINAKTRVVSVIGASNFLGVKPDLARVAQMARESGHVRPDGTRARFTWWMAPSLCPAPMWMCRRPAAISSHGPATRWRSLWGSALFMRGRPRWRCWITRSMAAACIPISSWTGNAGGSTRGISRQARRPSSTSSLLMQE